MGFSTTRNSDAKLGLVGRCGLPNCLHKPASSVSCAEALPDRLSSEIHRPVLLRHAPFGAGVSQASADMPIRAKTAGPRPRLLLKLARADKLRRRRRGDEPVAGGLARDNRHQATLARSPGREMTTRALRVRPEFLRTHGQPQATASSKHGTAPPPGCVSLSSWSPKP